MRRIGIFGGSFDPVHTGHLILAESARDELALDTVWFVPSPRPPHKAGLVVAALPDRSRLLRLAIAGRNDFEVRDLESGRAGASYTVDTLRQVHADHPDDELFFLMGSDSLADLPRWRDPEGIASAAVIVAVNRGFAPAELPKELSPAVADRVQIIEMPACGISASDIRHRVATGKSVRYLVPRAVEEAIRASRLYRDSP